MFAEGPCAKPGAKKPAADAKKPEPAKPAAPTLAPPRLVKTSKPAAASPPSKARDRRAGAGACAAPIEEPKEVAGAGRWKYPPSRLPQLAVTHEPAPVVEEPLRRRPWHPLLSSRQRRSPTGRCASGALEAGAGARPHGAAEHQAENRRAERARHLGRACDADSSGCVRVSARRTSRAAAATAPLPPATGNLARPGGPGGGPGGISTRPAPQRPSYPPPMRPNAPPGGPRPLPTQPIRPPQGPQGMRPSGGVGQQRPGAPRFTPPPMRPAVGRRPDGDSAASSARSSRRRCRRRRSRAPSRSSKA